MAATAAAKASDGLDADSFRKLYPEAYHQKFLDDGIRHSGRILGRARETAISVGTITSAEGSSLVKQGETSVLAGVRLAVTRPSDATPSQGCFSLNVEIAAFSSAAWAHGRTSELMGLLHDRLHQVLLGGDAAGRTGCFSLQQLCIAEGKAAWSLTLDLYVLNVDGSLQDAALLAAVAALLNTQLPTVIITPDGQVQRQEQSGARSGVQLPVPVHGGAGSSPEQTGQQGQVRQSQPLVLDPVSLSLTCALYKGLALVDPDAEEENALASSLVTVVLDQHHHLHGVHKPGGAPATRMELLRCVESSKLRYREVWQLLQQALENAAVDADHEMQS